MPSSAAGEAVKPRSASNAARSPVCAPCAGISDDTIVACMTRKPAACDSAMPMAYCSRVASSFSSLAAATAAPMPAAMPVCDQATVPFAGGTEIAFDSRQVISMPSAQRQQQVRATGGPPLRQRQRRGGDRTGRMHHRLGMRVIIRVDTGAEAVDQAGMQRVGFAAAADHRGVRRAGIFAERLVGEVHHLVPRAADGAAEDVDERAQRLAPHGVRQVGPARRDDVVGEARGDVTGGVDECIGHGASPSQRACRAAVDVDDAALDEVGLLRGEIGGEPADLLRPADARGAVRTTAGKRSPARGW